VLPEIGCALRQSGAWCCHGSAVGILAMNGEEGVKTS
jgi:hypothetical protein